MLNISQCGDIIDLISLSKNWYNCGKKNPVSFNDKYRVLFNEIKLFKFYLFKILLHLLCMMHVILGAHGSAVG
jgi:hypothetical protein